MNSLLDKQIARSRKAGTDYIDYAILIKLVRETYEEYTRTRKMQDRAIQLVSDELNDLNAQIRAENAAALADSQSRFELAVESTSDGVWDWDVSKNAMWISSIAKKMLGYAPEDMNNCKIGDWYDLVVKEDRPKAQEIIDTVLSGGAAPPTTLRFSALNGEVLYIMCRVASLKDAAGKVARVVGVHTDVTGQLAIHETLKAARDKAEAANRAKSDFLANMSHEIRTPMNSIMGMTNLLLDTQIDSQQRLWLDIVKNSSESLLDIINDILDLSKIEADGMRLEEVPFDIVDLVDQATDTLIFKIKEKNLELLLYLDPALPRTMQGDQVRLRQILINLIGNAIKFTPRGHIALRIAPLAINGEIVDLSFEIEDTGIGIAADKIDYIFEKFAQAEESTARKFGGTGLGLAICKRLVTMMNGEIGVRSVPGKGSVFHFHIPFAMANSVPIAPKTDLSSRKILVVDDNLRSLGILKEYLQYWNADVHAFGTGQGALDKLKQDVSRNAPFDTVILDHHLPLMGGYGFAAAAKEIQPQGLKFMVLRSGDPGRPHEMMMQGFDSLLLKPISPARFLALVEAVHKEGGTDIVVKAPVKRDHRDFSKLNVLVVEDLKANQVYMHALLKKHNCIPDMAANGIQALEQVAKKEYDIIFMDCQMPEMDGFEATQELRKLPLPRQPFIVALTADAMEGDRERCLKVGMDEYLNKPVKGEKVISILQRFTDK